MTPVDREAGRAGTGRRVLVTGGGGFLGAWIIRRLTGLGFAVRIFDLAADRRLLRSIAGGAAEDVEWVCGDVSDTSAMVEAAGGCTEIIHLAGLLTPACKDDPLLGARVNVIGTINAFEAARAHDIDGVIYTSSGGVFGPDDHRQPLPTTHYGAYKLASEGNARAYWEDARLSSIGFRPFVIYGPGRESGLTAGITTACRAAANGSPYVVGFRGEVALVYVDDVATAYVRALLELPVGASVINLTGHLTTVEETVGIIREIVPDAKIGFEGPPIPSASGAANEWATCGLGLAEERTLHTGLAETIAFYREKSD